MKTTITVECDNDAETFAVMHRLLGTNTIATPPVEPTKVKTVVERPNVSPGDSSITKMGQDMKKAMLAAVGSGAFKPNYDGKSLKYLQLLWKRGEIKFDGKEFYK